MHRHWRAGRRVLASCWLALLPLGAVDAQDLVQPDVALPDVAATTIPTDRPITLEEAIQIALQNFGTIATAEESVVIARQNVRLQRAQLQPQVTASATSTVTGVSDLGGIFGATGGQRITSPGTIQPVLGFSGLTLVRGGIPTLNIRQARTSVEAAQANLQATRNNVALAVSEAYLGQLRSQATMVLRTAQVQTTRSQLEQVLARIRVGDLAVVERFLPEADLFNAEVAREQAENDVRITSTVLRNLMGLPSGPPLQLVEPVLPPEGLNLPTLAQLELMAMERRPEVVSAEAALRIANLGLLISRRNRGILPTSTLSLALTPRGTASSANFALQSTLSVPVFSSIPLAQLKISRANARAQAAQLEQQRKDVSAQVDRAYFDYVTSLQQVESSRLQVEAADANLRATNERFRIGAAGITVVNLTIAQQQFFNANNNLIQSRYNVITFLARLNRAIGR
jgi:outer membrane protein